MQHLIKYFFTILLFTHYSTNAISADSSSSSVHKLISNGQAPEGVVFEIVSGNTQYLNWAMPEAEKLSRQLRNKYPSLDIAIVTHGWEQFSLTKKQLSRNTSLKKSIKTLIKTDVQIHVCGTHAEYNGVTAEEFSELIDVAAAGPSQINDYIKLGYIKIKINKE